MKRRNRVYRFEGLEDRNLLSAIPAHPAALVHTERVTTKQVRVTAAYAGTGGCPSLETQLSFADQELRREPAFGAFWRASSQSAFTVLRRCFGRGQC